MFSVEPDQTALWFFLAVQCITYIILGEMSFHVGESISSRSVLLYPWIQLQRFNQWIADWITSNTGFIASARKVLVGELLAWSLALMGQTEWAFTIFGWGALACVGISTALGWWKIDEEEGRPHGRVFSGIFLAAVGILMTTVNVEKKPEYEPWSSLQKLSILGRYRYNPVSVSPSVLEFRNLPNETYPITVTDNQDKDVYMIAIEFIIDNDTYNVYRISGDNIKNPTVVWWCQNAKHQSLFLVAINRIPAKNSVDLRVARDKPGIDTTIQAKVTYFTYNPTSFAAISASSVGMLIEPNDTLNNCKELGGATGIAVDPSKDVKSD
jgi:hypothetical protein